MWVVLAPLAYLLGTFPSAHLIAKANGIDIATFGSGNPGTSNVTRALGWRRGIWVFVLDAAKGAVAAGAGLLVDGRVAGYVLGAAAVVGHVYPVTRRRPGTRFRGGKGVATGGGIVLVMLPLVGVAVIALWWLVTKLTGTAAIGSIVAVSAAAIGLVVMGAPAWEFAAVTGVCLLIMSRHTENIRRLVTHDEPTLRSS